MSANLTPLDHIAIGRHVLRNKMPFLSTAALRLVPVAAPGLKTIGVSRDLVLMYDPEIVMQHAQHMPGMLLHELGHVMGNHHARISAYVRKCGHPVDARGNPTTPEGKQIAEVCNVAGDFTINPMVRDAGLTLPFGVYPSEYGYPEGLTMEEYADKILAEQNKEGKKASKIDGTGKPCCGKCGSGAGNALEGEPETDDPNETDDQRAERAAEVSQSAARAIRAHIEAGKAVPGFWKTFADSVLPVVKVDWREKLRRTIGNAIGSRSGASDFTYRKPSRRQGAVAGNVRLAAMHSTLPRVSVIVDTSGSMGTKEAAESLSHVGKIIEALGCPVSFMGADTESRAAGTVATVQQARKFLQGGGGTDFCAPLAAVAKERPSVVVYLTDGYGSAPAKPPPFRVIWVLVGSTHKRPAPWGECVEAQD